jgi:hypothetical protein
MIFNVIMFNEDDDGMNAAKTKKPDDPFHASVKEEAEREQQSANEEVWDKKTMLLQGTRIKVDHLTPKDIIKEMITTLESMPMKKDRIDHINENLVFIRFLAKAGKQEAINTLNSIADAGA